MTEFTDKIMRETIAACAVTTHKGRRGAYRAMRYNGRPNRIIAEVERVLTPANERSDRREQAFYEELYAAHGGDRNDLPWSAK